MGTGGFTGEGLAALDAALARHTSAGAVPGVVALVARGGEVHVTSAGHKAIGDSAPIGRDAIFRIASLTKPIVGVAAMLLIEDGAMALDDPVERWLPELSARRVLRSYDAQLSDTVPATGLTGILLTQRMMTSPEPPEVARDFWSAAYAALA